MGSVWVGCNRVIYWCYIGIRNIVINDSQNDNNYVMYSQ